MPHRVKIRNPFDPDQNMCFGCGPSNPAGLKLEFEEDGDKVYASWNPSTVFQGYVNTLHGGIIATLLDEVAAWCIYVKAGTAGVTSSMTVKYLKPVHISKGKVTAEAYIVRFEEKNAQLNAKLTDGEGKVCAEAQLEYFIFPEKVSRQRYNYPGKEAFYF